MLPHMGFSLAAVREGYALIAVHRLLIAAASLIAEHGLSAHWLQELQLAGSLRAALRRWSPGSLVVTHGLRGSVACRIFLDQGSNQCLPRCKMDS